MAYQLKDAYYRKAKNAGYRSRAAYKLVDLNRRFHIIERGDRVVDLGAAPGGWLQVAAELTGAGGRVIGVDLAPITPVKETHVAVLQGDVQSDETLRKTKELLGGLADSVISDVAPRLSGIRDADLSRSLELNRAALGAVCELLKPGGHFLVKVFMGEGFKSYSRELEGLFASVQSTRPEATRKGSSELYICAKNFRGKQRHDAASVAPRDPGGEDPRRRGS